MYIDTGRLLAAKCRSSEAPWDASHDALRVGLTGIVTTPGVQSNRIAIRHRLRPWVLVFLLEISRVYPKPLDPMVLADIGRLFPPLRFEFTTHAPIPFDRVSQACQNVVKVAISQDDKP